MENYNFFILRNNDLGDVLLVTPLLKGLKTAFPKSKVSIGVGDWAMPLLENNPHVDDIISCNAPWQNKQNCRFPANSPKTFLEGLLYVLLSKESRNIHSKEFTHGIDVLGSRQGSWLMRRAGIPNRLGVKGYAGGHNWSTKYINFQEDCNVAEAGLKFLKLMDTKLKVEPRPTIYLTNKEISDAEGYWGEGIVRKKRIILAPGGGFPEKCWGDQNFSDLTSLLLENKNYQVSIIGSIEDKNRISVNDSPLLTNLCGELSLRQTAAMVSQSDFVISNSSLCMHLAGAFNKPSIIVLSSFFDSAELHKKQWGYSDSLIIGLEPSIGIFEIATPEFVIAKMKTMLVNEEI